MDINRLFRTPAFWGILLILGGIALLLQNLLDIEFAGLFWGAAFIVGGFAFLAQLDQPDRPWWPLLPGVSMLGIGLTALLDIIFPTIANFLSGMLVMGGIGLAFILIYVRERRHWWALIPGGVLISIGLVSMLDQGDYGIDTGGILLLGIGITFLALAWLPDNGQKWAYIPGGILTVMGLFIAAQLGLWMNIIVPALIIILGGWLILRSWHSR